MNSLSTIIRDAISKRERTPINKWFYLSFDLSGKQCNQLCIIRRMHTLGKHESVIHLFIVYNGRLLRSDTESYPIVKRARITGDNQLIVDSVSLAKDYEIEFYNETKKCEALEAR